MQYLLIILISIVYSCNNQEIQNISKSAQIWTGGDITPPLLTDIHPINDKEIILTFNEHLYKEAKDTHISDTITIKETIIRNKTLTIMLNTPTYAGKLYSITTKVKDTVGNSLYVVESIYGYNNNIPRLLISEFTTEGSKKNPDKTEIIALSNGNLAGITLREGGIHSFKQQIIFPHITVKNGDFIIIHWNPDTSQYTPKTETQNKKESSYPMSYNTAWDIFSNNGKGISNTNGMLILLESPHGKIIDAVIYSTKKDTNDKYNGFGNKNTFLWAKEIAQSGEWKSHLHSNIFPSDTINPYNSSTTRSISRDSSYTDTNSASDWHITPSRKNTFASQNTNDAYIKNK